MKHDPTIMTPAADTAAGVAPNERTARRRQAALDAWAARRAAAAAHSAARSAAARKAAITKRAIRETSIAAATEPQPDAVDRQIAAPYAAMLQIGERWREHAQSQGVAYGSERYADEQAAFLEGAAVAAGLAGDRTLRSLIVVHRLLAAAGPCAPARPADPAPPQRPAGPSGLTVGAAHAVRATFAGTSAVRPGLKRGKVLAAIQAAPDATITLRALSRRVGFPASEYVWKLREKGHVVLLSLADMKDVVYTPPARNDN